MHAIEDNTIEIEATKDYVFKSPAVKAYREAASQTSTITEGVEGSVGMNEDASSTASYDLPEALVDEDRAIHPNARAGGRSD